MREYLDLLSDVLENGRPRADRTGTGGVSVFGRQARFALSPRFPLLTTKKIHWPAVAHELLWFLRGETNTAYLRENGVRIWDAWADAAGELGPVYGAQWRRWRTADGGAVDQISEAVRELRANPLSRRVVVSAWNAGEIGAMRLPPCHLLFQFHATDGALSCHMYQRSADLFLGVPFNIASYALLTRMTAQVCGLAAGELVVSFGDLHLYNNHLEQARTQLSRAPKKLPRLELNPAVRELPDFRFGDLELLDYDSHPRIAGEVSV